MKKLFEALESVGAIVMFTVEVTRSTLTTPFFGGELIRIMWLLIKRCLIPVGLAVAPVGAVISLQGLEIFRMFGLDRMLSSLLGTAIFREYSPALASVMVAAQAGYGAAKDVPAPAATTISLSDR